MSQLILALDCGSTHFKAALFTESLQRLSEATVAVPYTVFTNREVELDATQVWDITVELLKAVCATASISPRDVTHFSITSQAQTFAVFRADGEALTPLYSWLDKRAETESGVLQTRLGDAFHRHTSFPTPVAQLQSAKLLWLSHTHPEFLPSDSLIIPLSTFIAWKLAGTFVIDDNLAAMSGLYSMRQQGWWRELLELCDITPLQLPELVPVGAAVAARRRCAELPLRKDVIIVCAGNDQTSGAVGNQCAHDSLIITLGTALVVYRHAGFAPGPYSRGGIWGPYPGGGFYELATRDEGCLALDWAREQLMPQQDTDAFMQAAEAAFKQHGHAEIRFVPQNIRTEKAWEIPDGSTPDLGEYALSVVEGINGSARQLLEDDLGVALTNLNSVIVIGGGSQSSFWRELLSQILGCPVRRGNGDSLLGAARMAAQVLH